MSSCDGRNLCSTSILGGYCSSTYDGVGGAMDNKGEKEKTSKKRCMDAMEGRQEIEQEIEDEEDGVKKRRLSFEQVKTLEKNFELGNKLDPEKKLQLAKSLGLQPRQIAVWFQNRRARWKTKQLEKDFDSLKRDYDSLMSRYNALLEEKHHFKAEVERLNKELEVKGMRENGKMEGEFFFEHERKPVKMEVCGKCTEPKMQGDMNQQQHQQEGGCSSIISEASSVFNLDSPHNNMDSPPLESKDTMKNSHDASLYCPKIEKGEDDDGRETGLSLVPCCGLFYGLEDQETLLWEYWNPDS